MTGEITYSLLVEQAKAQFDFNWVICFSKETQLFSIQHKFVFIMRVILLLVVVRNCFIVAFIFQITCAPQTSWERLHAMENHFYIRTCSTTKAFIKEYGSDPVSIH